MDALSRLERCGSVLSKLCAPRRISKKEGEVTDTSKWEWWARWAWYGVPTWIIVAFGVKHGEPPEWLTKTLELDIEERYCGIAKMNFGYRFECNEHDVLHILQMHGFEVEPIVATQGRFLGKSLLRAPKDLLVAVTDPLFGLIGATVGTGLMVWRKLKRSFK